jgi:uncharacterized membrane protein (UPF0136 family)
VHDATVGEDRCGSEVAGSISREEGALEFVSSIAEFPSAMKFCGRWFIGFGIFLFVCGLAGFLSNPSGAKTALISGGTFGFLSALSGVLMSRGLGWAWMVALGCTGFLAAVFTWRAAAGWMAYSTGQPKLFAASLITLMLAGSLISIGVLVKNRHRGVKASRFSEM